MSAVATPTRPKATTKRAKPAPSPTEREFIKGRDLAIHCLEEAQAFEVYQSPAPNRLRWARKGEAQDNFVLGYIADTVGGPAMLENQALRGFCAVLSDYLSKPGVMMYPHAYKLPYAEYQEGEIGADGTEPTLPDALDDAAAGPVATPAADPVMRPHNMTNKQKEGLHRKMHQASALLELLIISADGEDDHRDGMMGTLQFADRLLTELHTEIMKVDGRLPDDLRWRTFEAHSIVAMVERLTFDRGWDRTDYDNSQLICWFDAANECLIRAMRSLDTLEMPNA